MPVESMYRAEGDAMWAGKRMYPVISTPFHIYDISLHLFYIPIG